jgi:pullulanase/glycogen debranching enzyme
VPHRDNRILRASLDTPDSGTIEFARDWDAPGAPPVVLNGSRPLAPFPLPEAEFAERAGYHVDGDAVVFVLHPAHHPEIPLAPGDAGAPEVYVAGDFNGWGGAIGAGEWRLRPAVLDGVPVLSLGVPAARLGGGDHAFKFVTGGGRWLPVPADAPNAVGDGAGNVNRSVTPGSAARHLWRFKLPEPLPFNRQHWLALPGQPPAPLRPDCILSLGTDLPLGATVAADANGGVSTTYRLFAPRATGVLLSLCRELEGRDRPERHALAPHPGQPAVWEITLPGNHHHWFYWFNVSGPEGPWSHFNPAFPVLDPWAKAALNRGGPGIVLDPERTRDPHPPFTPPAWHDLAILEAHLCDLTRNGPVPHGGRPTFTTLAQCARRPDFHPARLGVNALELQPVQEFDNATPSEYHWGYMTANFFAPASAYSTDPARATGSRELRNLSAALHQRGIALILDVVYNHVGEPNHLLHVDKFYWFNQDAGGGLSNWSGCGNDLRCGTPVARRLLIESLLHLLSCGADGFRFDLAELIGAEVLRDIEAALKARKPSVILIAEPWSFRGHIAGELRDTGYASWNDGYRDALRRVVAGEAPRETVEYYLKGSPWHYAKWPAQTVNYTESHDDRAWIDVITQNPGNDGFAPTASDRRRTHLMCAFLCMSIGIPMLAEGQDFLRSKRGHSNTYRRGDLNALDYARLAEYPATHAYFRDWLAFRQGDIGRLLRHHTRASENFLKFHWAEGGAPAFAAHYNADRGLGAGQLLFLFNPSGAPATIRLPEALASKPWRQLADQERFLRGNDIVYPVAPVLTLPAGTLRLHCL